MQFCFMLRYGTTNAIFILGMLQEKHLAKKKNLYFAFVDLKRAFGQVPIDVVWCTSRKLVVEKSLVKVVQLLYRNPQSHVRVNGAFSDHFLVR